MEKILGVLAVLILTVIVSPVGQASAIVFGQPGGHKDVALTAIHENQFTCDPGTHCLGGMISADNGLFNPLTGAGGIFTQDNRTLYEPGDTVKLDFNIWNVGGQEVNDMPVSIGWFTYTVDYKTKPEFTPVQYDYVISGLEADQNTGIQVAEIKLPDSFEGLPLVTGAIIKERIASVFGESGNLSNVNDDDKFLSMAIIADPEKALKVWDHILAAQGGINKDGNEEIRYQNNIMLVLIPVQD